MPSNRPKRDKGLLIMLSEDERNKLHQMATEQDTSLTALTRQLLLNYWKSYEQP